MLLSQQNYSGSTLFKALNRHGRLDTLSPIQISSIISFVTLKTTGCNDVIINQGDASDGIYCVVDGQVRFYMCNEYGDELLFYVAHRGFWFGGTSLFANEPVPMTVRTKFESSLAFIPARACRDLAMSDSGFCRIIVDVLSSQLRLSLKRIFDGSVYPSHVLIARILCYLYAEATQGDIRNAAKMIAMTRQELSTMVGLSGKTIGRSLKVLMESGAIVSRYGLIEITSLPKLLAVAKLSRYEINLFFGAMPGAFELCGDIS